MIDDEIYLYQISSKEQKEYIISNADQIQRLTTHEGLKKILENSEEIKISRLGKVLIDELTMERITSTKT